MTPIKISNRQARWLWLSSQGLGDAPTGPLELLEIIKDLGFVQLDTIRVIARAHDHIIWSRNQNYREPMLNKLLAKDRGLFEHFTHDASVIPMEFYPMWHRQFARMKQKIDRAGYFKNMLNAEGRNAIKQRIEKEGPLSTHAFDTKIKGPKKMWARPPHKMALDYMWYSGELATSHRENFKKFYDLGERVFPQNLRLQEIDDQTQINWLCAAAMQRLAFATPSEIQKFWDAVEPVNVKKWVESKSHDLVPVEIEDADGNWCPAFAGAEIEEQLATLKKPTSRLRIMNPFDPVIRDRARLKRLFDFDYRVEMFVPEVKRKWGYYVFPLLEGDRLVGRLDAKADRKNSTLNISKIWAEPCVKWTSQRATKLEAELERMTRFVALDSVEWNCAHPT